MIKLMKDNYNGNMDELLKIIENSGMLPPRNPNATFTGQLEHNGLNYWEDE